MSKQQTIRYGITYKRSTPENQYKLWFATEIVGAVGSQTRGILVLNQKHAKLYGTIEAAAEIIQRFHKSDDYYLATDDKHYDEPSIVEIKTTVEEKELNTSTWVKMINDIKIKDIKKEVDKHSKIIKKLNDEIKRLNVND